MMNPRPALAMIGALASLALVAAAPADAKPRKKAARPPAAAAAPAPAQPPAPTDAELLAKANAEQAKAAADQNAQNAANQQAYQDAVKARDAQIARTKAEHDASMKKWEEDVAACKAGDRTRCAQPN